MGELWPYVNVVAGAVETGLVYNQSCSSSDWSLRRLLFSQLKAMGSSVYMLYVGLATGEVE